MGLLSIIPYFCISKIHYLFLDMNLGAVSIKRISYILFLDIHKWNYGNSIFNSWFLDMLKSNYGYSDTVN